MSSSEAAKRSAADAAVAHGQLKFAETFDTEEEVASVDALDDVETGAAVTDIDWSATEFSDQPSNQKRGDKANEGIPSIASRGCKRPGRVGWVVLGVTSVAMFLAGLSVGWTARKDGNDGAAVTTSIEDATADERQPPSLPSGITPGDDSNIDAGGTSSLNGLEDEMTNQDVEEEPEYLPSDILDSSSTQTSITMQPALKPSMQPTSKPSSKPSSAPSVSPTPSPTTPPTPYNPYFLGDEFVTFEEYGIEVSKGLSVRLIAKAGERVQYANGKESESDWHVDADAAGIVPLDPLNPLDGGYVYVSNSETSNGGVHGLYFDKHGNITDYRALLTGTVDNCGGGLTPWNTWVSCEESGEDGQCWQVDPIEGKAEETKLGGKGGNYESVAVDNRNPERPVFFVTEDEEDGALRRFQAESSGWDALHSDGETTFLNLLDDETFEWTDDEDDGRKSAEDRFPNTEGISFHEGKLYFMAKKDRKMFILDLEGMTYVTEETGKKFYGEGSFGDQPDQNVFGPTRRYIYFTEDGGSSPGVYARYADDGTYFTLFQSIEGGMHDGDETSGIALSPDHRRFYACVQHNGYCFEFAREDGLPFE